MNDKSFERGKQSIHVSCDYEGDLDSSLYQPRSYLFTWQLLSSTSVLSPNFLWNHHHHHNDNNENGSWHLQSAYDMSVILRALKKYYLIKFSETVLLGRYYLYFMGLEIQGTERFIDLSQVTNLAPHHVCGSLWKFCPPGCHCLRPQIAPLCGPSKLQDPVWWLCFQNGVEGLVWEDCINLTLTISQSLYSKAITPHSSGWSFRVVSEKALGIIPSRKGLFALWFIKTPLSELPLAEVHSGSFSQPVGAYFFVLHP